MKFLAIFASIVLLSACGRSALPLAERGVGDDGGALRVGTDGTPPSSSLDSGPVLVLRRNQPVVFSLQNRGTRRLENLTEASATTDVYRSNCRASLAPGERCLAAFVPSPDVRTSGPGTLEVTYTVAGEAKRWRLDVQIVIDGGATGSGNTPSWPPSSPWYPGYPTLAPTATPTPAPTEPPAGAPRIEFFEASNMAVPISAKMVNPGYWVSVYAKNTGTGKAIAPRSVVDPNLLVSADCNRNEWEPGYGCVVSYRLDVAAGRHAYITYSQAGGLARTASLLLFPTGRN